jgi:hypothetical protein
VIWGDQIRLLEGLQRLLGIARRAQVFGGGQQAIHITTRIDGAAVVGDALRAIEAFREILRHRSASSR